MSRLRTSAAAALLLTACSSGERARAPAAVARKRLLGVAVTLAAPNAPPAPSVVATPNAAGEDLGKRVFVEKCGSCHDADGAKPLDKGPPLSARGLALEAVQKTVDGRLSSATAEERRAVARYIAGLMSP